MSTRKNDASNVPNQKHSKPREINKSRKQIHHQRGFNKQDIEMAKKPLSDLIKALKKQRKADSLTRENVHAFDRNNGPNRPLSVALEIAKPSIQADNNIEDGAKNDQTIIRDIIREKTKVIERVEMFAACKPNVPKSDLIAFRNVMNVVYDSQLDSYTKQSSLPSSSGISSALARVDKSSMLHRFMQELPLPRLQPSEMSPLSSVCLSSHIGEHVQQQRCNETSMQTSKRHLSQTFDGKRDLI